MLQGARDNDNHWHMSAVLDNSMKGVQANIFNRTERFIDYCYL